ncbi:MAG TPA: hypothetical protein VI168_10345 [Croceibacterium sp.]
MAVQASLMSRRNILLGLAGGAAVAGGVTVQQTGGVGDFADRLRPAALGRRGVNLANGTKADWALQVGTFFTAQTGHVLKLTSVQAFPERGRRPAVLRPGSFVARFDITSGGALQAAQFLRVNHAEGGAFDMFLTGGNVARPLRMLAVFN